MIERQSFFASPSITKLIVFCLNGNNLSNNNQPMIKIKIVNGNMNIIHSPKPRFKFKPSGSFKYFNAIAFGGVPIGVPKPPMFAPIGNPHQSSESEHSDNALFHISQAFDTE